MRISDWSSDVCSSDLREQRSHFLLRCHQSREARPQQILLPRYAQHRLATRRICQLHHLFPFRFQELNIAERPPQSRSEEHTSELQSLMRISYAVFCLKKKKTM